MKTSNKLIIIAILITIASPFLYGFLIFNAAKHNLAKGLEFEKMILSDTVNISTGDFNSLDLEAYPHKMDHIRYLNVNDWNGSYIYKNVRAKVVILPGDSSFIRTYGSNSRKHIKFNNEGILKIHYLYGLPYFKLSENSYYKMHLKMNAPDLEIFVPKLKHIEAGNNYDVRFDKYTTDSLNIFINNSLVDGQINADFIKISGQNSHFMLNTSTAKEARFDISNGSTLIWGSVADTMHVSGFRDAVIKIQKNPRSVNFRNIYDIRDMAVFVPDSAGKMIDVAKLLSDQLNLKIIKEETVTH